MAPRNSSLFPVVALAMALTAGIFASPRPAHAVGGDEDQPARSSATTEQYQSAKRAIDAGKYTAAIATLEALVKAEPKNANAWNLLAYSNRKLKRFDAALGFYRTALRLDPEHRGAHEYLGELYLDRNDLKSALAMRAKLQDLCPGSCEELDDLDKAIADFKAGKKAAGWGG